LRRRTPLAEPLLRALVQRFLDAYPGIAE